jgi:glycosyltransferase involved in cell wall biosynthesis
MGKLAELDARQLAALDMDVHVYTPGRRGEGEVGRGEGYRVHGLTCLKYGNAAFAPGIGVLLNKYPLVVLHYPFFGGAEPLAAAKRMAGPGAGKLLVVYHMDVVGRGPLRWLFALHKRWFAPSILRQAERLLVTSLDYAKYGDLAGLFAEESERFRELGPSVDTAKFSPGPKPPELLKRYGLKESDRIAVFVGGLDKAHYFKGVPRLLAALTVRELSSVKAVVVGSGDLLDSFKKTAHALGIADRVVFTGPVTDEELAAHYRLGDVFAFPSIDRSEAFGIAALESMACGVPVIATELPGVRTIVREGETGFRVFPGSASALSSALARLFGDEELRRKLGAAGREMAVREYSDAARLKKWKAILDEIKDKS